MNIRGGRKRNALSSEKKGNQALDMKVSRDINETQIIIVACCIIFSVSCVGTRALIHTILNMISPSQFIEVPIKLSAVISPAVQWFSPLTFSFFFTYRFTIDSITCPVKCDCWICLLDRRLRIYDKRPDVRFLRLELIQIRNTIR